MQWKCSQLLRCYLSFAKLVDICLKHKHWAAFCKICCTRSLSQPIRLSPSRFPPAGVGLFLKDQPYGVVNLVMLRGSVDALRQHCPTKRLTPMGLFAGESVRCFCGFRRRIAHIPLRVYMGVRENTCKQALRLDLLTPLYQQPPIYTSQAKLKSAFQPFPAYWDKLCLSLS